MNSTALPATTVATAVAIVTNASRTARRFFRSPVEVAFKADESPVTVADKTVEAEIRVALQAAFPDDGILGEEHGTTGADSQKMWIVDPIDGTRSFISGHPLFGMLLGLTENGVPQLGVVGMPALDEIYVGVPGKQATLNGDLIAVSSVTDLDKATVYVNEGDRIFAKNPAIFRRLMTAGQTRRFAYDCYPYALLAAGHVDVVVDCGLQPYDYLPVMGLVQGAGGIMTDWQGKPLQMGSDINVIAAATPDLHTAMLALLAGETP